MPRSLSSRDRDLVTPPFEICRPSLGLLRPETAQLLSADLLRPCPSTLYSSLSSQGLANLVVAMESP